MRPRAAAWHGLLLALALAAGPAAAQDLRDQTMGRLGLEVDRGAPITISAEEFDAVRDEDGAERVVFRRKVRLQQGDLHLSCDWLEALYPDGAGGRPARITARGSVALRQADTEVHCTEALFDDAACSVRCASTTGPAVLRRGDDVVEGREIHFDLCKGLVKVRGGGMVTIQPRAPAKQDGE